MPLNFEKIADRALEDTDGQNNFARMNLSMSDAIASIRPHALAVLSYTLFVKCLAKVPKYADLPSNNDNSPTTGDADRGRWSFIISASDILDETTYSGDESNINKNIKILISRHMFFKFMVPIGKSYVYICTYNRYPLLTGLFWPEHEKNWKSNFSPVVTPKVIASLASDKSYKNALSRLCRPLHNKMRAHEGWETMIEVENRVKEAFCASFLENLIAGACPAVKSHFKSFHESGLDHDAYVSYVWKTSKSLNPYQGIEINEKFLSNLRLPRKYMNKIQEEISNEKKLIKSSEPKQKRTNKVVNKKQLTQVQNTSDNKELTQVQNTSDNGLTQVQNTSDNGLTQVQNTSDNEILGGVKPLIDNDLQEKTASHQRIIHIKKNNNKDKEEIHTSKNHHLNSITNDNNDEISVDVDIAHNGETDESSYNANMNKNQQQDMSLSVSDCDKYAFADPSLLPHSNRAKVAQRKVEKIISPDDIERNVMKQIAKQHESAKRLASKRESATILNNAEKFVSVFRKLVKDTIPNAFYATSSSAQTRNDCYMSQMALDKLRERGAFDEEVLLAWMRFTVNACSKRKTFKGVAEMLRALPSFEKNIPAPETLTKCKSQKKYTSKTKNVIEKSMNNLFPDSFQPSRITLSCQFWGIPITAQYMASKTDEKSAKRNLVEALRKSTMSDVKGALSMSAKYESETSDMVFANWRTVLSKALSKIGKLDEFSMSETDLANVKEFSEKFTTK